MNISHLFQPDVNVDKISIKRDCQKALDPFYIGISSLSVWHFLPVSGTGCLTSLFQFHYQ